MDYVNHDISATLLARGVTDETSEVSRRRADVWPGVLADQARR